MTDKDAALEQVISAIAEDCCLDDLYWQFPSHFTEYYNAARKPLEDLNIAARNSLHETIEKLVETQQQLIATQEAYQRVVEALNSRLYSGYCMDMRRAYMKDMPGTNDIPLLTIDLDKVAQALANPPSLEAVERKKLQDEMALIRQLYVDDRMDNLVYERMIAERKAKLEKMKNV